jgi:hypothetical protein
MPSGVLCGTIQRQLSDFQIHFVKQFLGNPGKVVDLADHTKKASFLQKTGSHPMTRSTQNGSSLRGKSKNMRARPEIRDILIAHKLRYWSLRAQYPTAFPNCSTSRARRNFLRLLARHPETARRLKLDVRSAYPPL